MDFFLQLSFPCRLPLESSRLDRVLMCFQWSQLTLHPVPWRFSCCLLWPVATSFNVGCGSAKKFIWGTNQVQHGFDISLEYIFNIHTLQTCIWGWVRIWGTTSVRVEISQDWKTGRASDWFDRLWGVLFIYQSNLPANWWLSRHISVLVNPCDSEWTK